MKITGIRTVLYEYDQDRPIGDANSPRGRQHVAQLAVFVDTDAGISGEAMGSPGAAGIMHGMARDLLVGEDPRGVRGLWQRMVDLAFKGNNRGGILVQWNRLEGFIPSSHLVTTTSTGGPAP